MRGNEDKVIAITGSSSGVGAVIAGLPMPQGALIEQALIHKGPVDLPIVPSEEALCQILY
ncbi:hypothetical protein IQ22_03233 [Pseudomonas duriflava]|uniref:Uncharacterized protein n=1 Tax=Pseudomonas duriflava TaxID=459528 RepID=A0A562Q6X9_9PSED|nr:hypothetical protein IQ22_03233 [Pseudomonas duriflava]